ncbi:MAG: SCO family protein [Hyphomicrobiales bacterium]|nr:MAG: SCO family protein [Hyphomicrobiales bacterium]
MNKSLLIAGIVAALLVGALLWGLGGPSQNGGGNAVIGGDFTLTDQTGKQVSDKDFRGRYMLIYFGYTFCPEICPTELQDISEALDLLGDDAAEIAPLFITVDPDRDTVKQMSEYVPLFHKSLIGLTGTKDQIAAVAKAYRVYYARQGEGSSYEMDHSSLIYFMDKQGQYAAHFAYGVKPDEIARRIREVMAKKRS